MPLEGGEHLTAVVQKTSLAATTAARSGVANVQTWGSQLIQRPENEPFPEVLRTGRADNAFAAILEDGTVAAWGDPSCGGDCNREEWQLMCGAEAAFAIQQDGHVLTWGAPHRDGDSRSVQNALVGVREIRSTTLAFAAVRRDGHVVTWGDPDYGGGSEFVTGSQTCRTFRAVIALLLLFWKMVLL